MPRRLPFRFPLLAAAGLFAACATAPKVYSKRVIDTPTGERIIPGAIQRTSYLARVSMEHNIAHVVVLERSECPAIKVLSIERIEETLDGEKVVERVDKGAHEKAETLASNIQCEARFARVPIALQYGPDTYPLGSTDDHGELHVDLGSAMKVNTRSVDLSAKSGVLLVHDAPAAEISMAGLLKQQQRVDAIVAQLSPLLGKEVTQLRGADVTNASMLFEELRELSPDDARTLALQRRFVEVVGGYRERERSEALKRNLSALSEAKELLVSLAAAPRIPAYVQLSISGDRPSEDALAWARAQALLALRQSPTLCTGGFDWLRAASLSGPERIAFSYLRYALDQDGLRWLLDACTR